MLYVLTNTGFDGAPLIGVFDSYELAYQAMEDFIYENYEKADIEDMGDGHWCVWEGQEDENENRTTMPSLLYIEACYPNTSLC